ncbi:MAG: hypothetical protein MZV63_70555 [Marinilabiliales bacterium]|nr:hypothetical protein [Marinilabiliales bacterium]
MKRHEIRAGYGVRNTSASMIPYLMSTDKPFILVSTGAWCTFMNPFNADITATDGMSDEKTSLVKIEGLQVKTSRALLGEIHDLNVWQGSMIVFGVTGELFKTIKIKSKKIKKMLGGRHGRIFFRHGMPEGYVDKDANLSHFLTYADAYHQMMFDPVDLCMESYRGFIFSRQYWRLSTSQVASREMTHLSGSWPHACLTRGHLPAMLRMQQPWVQP